MKRLLKKQILTTILSIFLLGRAGTTQAADSTWQGDVNDSWNAAANWDNGVPGASDFAWFSGGVTGPTYFNPIMVTDNSISTIQYKIDPYPYLITIDGTNGASTTNLTFIGPLPYSGVDNSQLGILALPQRFNLWRFGQITFGFNTASASADIGSTGLVTYNVNSDTVGKESFISFINSSTAGAATFNLGEFSTAQNIIIFQGSSEANTSTINAFNGSFASFTGTSTANSATINLFTPLSTVSPLSAVQFTSGATPDAATINADHSNVIFNTTDSTSNAKVALKNGSTLTVTQDISIDRLTSDSTNDAVVLSENLTVNGSFIGDVVKGVVSGAGGFIYGGTGSIELSNPANSYGGGTTISGGGKLIATTDSLPAGGAVSISATGTLEINNTNDTIVTNFTGPITNNGKILYTGSGDATLSGNISGTGGRLIVDATSDDPCCDHAVNCCGCDVDENRLCRCRDTGSLTISGNSVVFASATVNQGTLHIPLSQTPNTVVAPAGILDWYSGGTGGASGTGTHNVVNDGLITYTGSNVGTMTGIISGCGKLEVNAPGSGQLILTGLNTYTGDTTVIDGTLTVGPDALPFEGKKTVEPGAILEFDYTGNFGEFKGDITNNGTVLTSGSSFTLLSGDISGRGGVQVDTPPGFLSTTVLTGCNTYTGGTLVNGVLGAFTQSIPSTRLSFTNLSSLVITPGGQFSFINDECGVFTGTIQNDGILQVSSTADVALTGDIIGSGALTIFSTGQTITVLGDNIYVGGTNINTGTLATTTQSLPDNQNVSILAGAVLKLINTTFDPVVAGEALSGTINNGGLVLYAGTSDAEISANISGAGGLEMNAPINCCCQGGCSSCSNDPTCNLCKPLATCPCTSNSTCKPHAPCASSSTCATCTSCPSCCQAKATCSSSSPSCNASGCESPCDIPRLILSGTNTYTGTTTVTSGILQVDDDSLPNNRVVFVGTAGILDVKQTSVVGNISSAITNNGEVRSTGTSDVKFTNSISGIGKFVVDAPGTTTTLAGTNTYTGGTFVDNGRLLTSSTSLPVGAAYPSVVVKNTGTLSFDESVANAVYAGSIELCGPKTTLNFESGSSGLTLSGPITGCGSVAVNFANLTLTNHGNNYSGGTTVSPGRTLTGDSFSLQGNIVDDGTVVFNQNVAGAFCGSISSSSPGVGVIRKNGQGRLIFNCDSADFQGTTNILQGTFELNAILGGKLGIESARLAGNATVLGDLTLENGSSGCGTANVGGTVTIQNQSSYTGCITSQGLVSILNSSSLVGALTAQDSVTVSNNSLFSGTATIQGDLNVLNSSSFIGDSFIGGNALIDNFSHFSGNSGVNGNLSITNNSSISPGGNCIGRVVVGGNYVQDATSTYIWNVGKDCEYDDILVEGNASIDGTLAINHLTGCVQENVAYRLMHVEGVLTGTFANVTTNYGLFVPTIRYVNNFGSYDVLVNFTHLFVFASETDNQRQVGRQLSCIDNPSDELAAILAEIVTLASSPATIDEARLAFNQMSGMQYLSMMAANQLTGHKFIRQLYDPIRSIVTLTEPHQRYYADPCCSTICGESRPQFSGWLEAGGGHTTIDGDKNANGSKFNSYSITGGFQTRFCDAWTVGIAGSYFHDDINYNIGGSGKNRTGFVAAYGLYRPSSWYVFGDLAYGYSRNSIRRPIHIGDLFFSAKSNPKVRQELAYIEAGFDIPVCRFLIQPFLGFEGGCVTRGKVTETGAFPLNLIVYKKEHSNIYSRLGVHLSTDGMCKKYAVSVDLAWQCRLNNASSRIHEKFQSFDCCDKKFNIKGINFTRHSFDGAATFTAFVCDRWELFVEVAAEKWSRASTYDVTGGIKYSW